MYLNSPQSIFPWTTNLSFPVFLGALNKTLHVCHYEMWQSWSWLPDLDLQPEKGLTWLGHTWAVRQDLACRSRRIDNWDERMGGLECLRLAVPICRLPGAAMLLSYYHQSPPIAKNNKPPTLHGWPIIRGQVWHVDKMTVVVLGKHWQPAPRISNKHNMMHFYFFQHSLYAYKQ